MFGDLNFVSYFQRSGWRTFAEQVRPESRRLHAFPGRFHQTVVDGLIALYGSDPKVRRQGLRDHGLMAGKGRGLAWLRLCSALRRFGVI